MKFWKNCVLFYLGGGVYHSIELLWRGRSHGSMFFLGGLCFTLMGWLYRKWPRLSLPVKVITGSGMVTALELLTGLLVNRGFAVWDYRELPFNFRGQICLNYSLLWMPLTLFGMWLNDAADRCLSRKKQGRVSDPPE